METGDVLRMDAIDEELLARDKDKIAVSLYLSDPESVESAKAFLSEHAADIPYTMSQHTVDEEDFANAWKQYYTVIKPADRILIVPEWLTADAKEGELPLKIDPGMAFGTGTHETTRLCIALLEKTVTAGDSLLDIGTGSGILSVAAKLLGSGKTVACDIDPIAVRVAKENAARNNLETQIDILQSDLTTGITGKYKIIVVNIIADVIIKLLPAVKAFMEPDATLLLSGIIDIREEDVLSALEENGLEVEARREEKGWIALSVKTIL